MVLKESTLQSKHFDPTQRRKGPRPFKGEYFRWLSPLNLQQGSCFICITVEMREWCGMSWTGLLKSPWSGSPSSVKKLAHCLPLLVN